MNARADSPDQSTAQDCDVKLRTSSEHTEDIARLREISTRLFSTIEIQPVLEEVLDAAISLLDADFGNVQLYDPESHSLKIVAHRGFEQQFLDYFNSVPEGTASCGTAFERRERVIVEDVLSDPAFAPHLEIVAGAGYRAVQSTPLFSRGGDLLGMISTHFRQPHRPSERSLCVLDLYAIQAAEVIERRQAESALRASEARFRSLVHSLPAAVYTCDVDGRVTLFNDSATALWGRRAELERDQWCGSLKLHRPDGSPLPLSESPMAVTLKAGRATSGEEVVIERPDGTRRNVIAYPELLRGASGAVVGAVNMLVDITERKRAETETMALKNALATELAGMTRLHEFSTSLLAETDLQRLLEDVLDAIVALQNADFGILQLYNAEARTLEIVAQRGFGPGFLQRFGDAAATTTASARAMSEQRRVIVEDVETDAAFAPYRETAAVAGFRAVQSTPMFSRTAHLLGVISTNFRQPHRPSDDVLRMTDLYARQAAEMIESKQSDVAVRKYRQDLQELTKRLIEAQEIQSKHLARELHDAFSQRLAAIGMELARVAHACPASVQSLGGQLRKLTEQIGKLAGDIHGISRQIHPAILDDLGLTAAIRSECLAFSEQYGMPAEFTADDIPWAVPEGVALCLYRIAQESLRNIGKHAGVSHVSVRLMSRSGELILAIDDAGHGFDPETIKGKRGLGLVSMEERLRIVGGTLSIRSQQESGTHVVARVPVTP